MIVVSGVVGAPPAPALVAVIPLAPATLLPLAPATLLPLAPAAAAGVPAAPLPAAEELLDPETAALPAVAELDVPATPVVLGVPATGAAPAPAGGAMFPAVGTVLGTPAAPSGFGAVLF